MKNINFKKITLGTLALMMIGGSVVIPSVTSHKVSALTQEEIRQNMAPFIDATNAAESNLHSAKQDLQSLLDDNARVPSVNLNKLHDDLVKAQNELAQLDASGAPMQQRVDKDDEISKIQDAINAAKLPHDQAEINAARQQVADAQAAFNAAKSAEDAQAARNRAASQPAHTNVAPAHTTATTKTGWHKNTDNSGHSRWYFFNNDHSIRTDHDWVKYGNYWMFSTGTNGYLTNEWAFIKKENSTNSKAWFYFDNDGIAVKSGWKKLVIELDIQDDTNLVTTITTKVQNE